MNAISPFSLIDKLGAGKAIGAAAGFIADTARDTAREATRPGGGLGAAFSEIWDRLDADRDGRLTGHDALGHAVMAGAFALDTAGRAMGFDMARNESPRAAPGGSGPPAAGVTTPAQMLLNAAPDARGGAGTSTGAPPDGFSGVLAEANGPGPAIAAARETIHATYRAMRNARP